MAGGLEEFEDEGLSGINVVPLVDIMLVLLIIFMVASAYIVKPSIEVELPKAMTGNEQTPDTTLSIILSEDRRLELNGNPATLEDIARKCRELSKTEKDPQAMISADKRVNHGRVVQIIDTVRRNGVLKFAINIDPAVVASPD